MRKLRDPVLMTIHLYSKVRIGFRGRCWETIQYKITTKIRRLKGSNAVSLQLPWPTTAAAQHPTHPKDNTSHFHPLLEMATNKNDIISQLSDCSSSSDEQFYSSPEHLSSSLRKIKRAQQEQEEAPVHLTVVGITSSRQLLYYP